MIQKRYLAVLAAACAVATLLGACSAAQPSAPAAASKWPTKPIIFVAPSNPGGGGDVLARVVANSIEATKAVDQPIAVINKGEGGAQTGYAYVKDKKGDSHYAFPAAMNLIGYVLMGDAPFDWRKDFVPLVNTVFDLPVIVTSAPDKYKTINDVVAAAKANPGKINIVGGSLGTQDHYALLTFEEAAGVKFNYVAVAGGANVHRYVLGGQADLAVGNPSDFMASLEPGKLKGLALLDEKRSDLPVLKEIPTAKEQGINAAVAIWRGWFAPAGIPKEQASQLEALITKASQAKEFKETYLDKFGGRAAMMNSTEFAKFLDEQEPLYKRLFKASGVIK